MSHYDELHHSCGGAGCREVCEADALRAEVADLKARLRAVRKARMWSEVLLIVNLRRKNWRTP